MLYSKTKKKKQKTKNKKQKTKNKKTYIRFIFILKYKKRGNPPLFLSTFNHMFGSDASMYFDCIEHKIYPDLHTNQLIQKYNLLVFSPH